MTGTVLNMTGCDDDDDDESNGMAYKAVWTVFCIISYCSVFVMYKLRGNCEVLAS